MYYVVSIQYCVLLLLCFTSVCIVWGNSVAEMEYEYSEQRTRLKRLEMDFANKSMHLKEDEKIVDHYFEYLKRQEYLNTQPDFLPALPIQEVLPRIIKSDVFRVLKDMPKGGNLHLHQNHILDKGKMLDIIFGDDHLRSVLCVQETEGKPFWTLGFYNTTPPGWEKVTSNTTKYSKDNILQHITFLNIMSKETKSRPTDSRLRWKEMNPTFGLAGSDLVLYVNYTRLHLRAMFADALEENIQYLEARLSMHSLYTLDDSHPEGHRDLDSPEKDGDSWFNVVREEIAAFKEKNPLFIGYKDIIQLKRFKSRERIHKDLVKAINLAKRHPDIVKGIDLVAEEDYGHSLLYFVDDLLMLTNGDHEKLSYFLHTSETKMPGDLVSSPMSDDPVATDENAYDAIILGAKRIGHGLGLIKHPYLLQVLKEKKIPIEVNPTSNMILGYTPDIRNHPGINYIRNGVPVILSADDPGTMGFDYFTIDWYTVFMSWGLDLSDMRKLATNSIVYARDPRKTYTDKAALFQIETTLKFYAAWTTFILKMKEEACSANLGNVKPEFHRVFPSGGPTDKRTMVNVYGRSFEAGVCGVIVCRFGDVNAKGQYVYNTKIQCHAPIFIASTVDLSISFNNGTTFLPTGSNFTFFEREENVNSSALNTTILFG